MSSSGAVGDGGRTLSRIRWVSVVMGVAATLAFVYLLTRLVFSVISSYLDRTIMGQGPGVNAREYALFDTLTMGSLLIALLLAFFLGSLLIGGVGTASPGLNGAVSVVVAAVGYFALEAGSLVAWIWEPVSYLRTENLYALLGAVMLLCLSLPFVALVGYLGGKLGRRLRSRSVTASGS